MLTILIATWATLFVTGVLTQLISPMMYGIKLANQTAGIMSILFLTTSAPVAWYAFEAKMFLVLLFFTIYLCVNAWLLIEWRFHPLRTVKQVTNTAYRSIILLTVILVLLEFNAINNTSVAVVSLLATVYVAFRIQSSLRNSQPNVSTKKHDRGTVTLAVPARNETHALTQHLKSVVTSEYSKLEVLVLDDCSQDDTAQIIRSFAHAGVRFVQGVAPQDTWIGKNGAYHLLAEEASGNILLFSGVDTRYSKQTIDALVHEMEVSNVDMLSVLPQHQKVHPLGAYVQPIRYLLSLGFSSPRNPPVLSTVWMIRTSALEKLGGFEAVNNTISPEKYFARELAKKKKYKFIISNAIVGLTSYKKPSSQVDTAIRVTYPLLHKSLFNHLLLSLAFVLVFGYPVVFTLTSLLGVWSFASTLFVLALLLQFAVHNMMLRRSYNNSILMRSPVLFAIGLPYYYILSIWSALAYENDKVIWKGRNICRPVMHPKV